MTAWKVSLTGQSVITGATEARYYRSFVLAKRTRTDSETVMRDGNIARSDALAHNVRNLIFGDGISPERVIQAVGGFDHCGSMERVGSSQLVKATVIKPPAEFNRQQSVSD